MSANNRDGGEPAAVSTFPPAVLFRGQATSGSWGNSMACPFCGNDCCHLIEVSSNPGGPIAGKVSITRDGVSVDKSVTPQGRGVAVVVRFACEAGHQFRLEFKFHKGSTFAQAASDGEPNLGTIWRD